MVTPSMRKGRELELLIARIKELQLPDARILSPQKVKDRDTGQEREIDVGIRIAREGDEIFIAVETRDRGAVQDVQWVEQLIAKKQSVGADVLIAVSRSGFSQPARIKALKRGVILTQMLERVPQDVSALANAVYITLRYVAPRRVAVDLTAAIPLPLPLTDYRYRHQTLGRELTLDELCEVWSHPNLIRTITGRIDDFAKAKFAKVSLADIRASVLTAQGTYDIVSAELSYEMNYGELPLPLVSVQEYVGTDAANHQNATAFGFGDSSALLSEVLLDQQTNNIRWDLIASPLLAEGKIVIGGRLRAKEPVEIRSMRLEL